MKLKAFLLVLLALLVNACGAQLPHNSQAVDRPPVSKEPPTDPVMHALGSSVILWDKEEELVCAAQRISPTLLVTAHHCIVAATANAEQLELWQLAESDSDEAGLNYEKKISPVAGTKIFFTPYHAWMGTGVGEPIPAVPSFVAAKSAESDLAILQTAASSQEFVELRASGPLAIGEMVFSIGHPAGLEFSYSRGYVSNHCRFLSGPECWLQVDTAIYGGNSGGGLFDANGKLIGIASRRVGFNYGFYAPLGSIAKLLSS